MFVQQIQLVLSYGTLSNEIFCGSCYLCAYNISKTNLFLNHMDRKLVGGTHNIILHYVHISAPGLFGVVLCNCFK